jgi:F-type H+-transporting ATPase subunit epsilon
MGIEMAEKLTLELVTPLKKVVAGQADMVILPAFYGEMGVLPGHELYMTLLETGVLRMETGDQSRYFFVSQGYAEIDNDTVRILAEVCEPVESIDLDRALAAHKRAEERLAKAASDESIDIARAQGALRRSFIRQTLIQQQRH